MIKRHTGALLGLGLLLALLSGLNTAEAQSHVDMKFHLHRHVEILDQPTIDAFLDVFAFELPPTLNRDAVEKIELIDTYQDGYGLNDLYVVHPQLLQGIITDLPETLARLMSTWNESDADRDLQFPVGELRDTGEGAEKCLALRTLSALQTSYDGDRIGMHVTYSDSIGYRMILWDYDPASFIPLEGGCLDLMEGNENRLDLLVTQSRDTVWVPDTVMVDYLVIRHYSSDSVFTGRSRAPHSNFKEAE
jgi:hypothetical protein